MTSLRVHSIEDQHTTPDITGQAYPLPRPDADPRFTFGLTYDVAKLIEAAGYPPVRGVDVIALQQALYRFLYTDGGAR